MRVIRDALITIRHALATIHKALQLLAEEEYVADEKQARERTKPRSWKAN